MKHIGLNKCNVVSKSLDVMNVIRQRSEHGQVDDESVYICNISDIVEKCEVWKQHLPRVTPFYGKCIESHVICCFYMCNAHYALLIYSCKMQ